ncbi:hypothetical protein [Nocardia tengchongensis]|uniref:hypothetical protein n=1 Tax=Nocardia tengchongensis TaxID=2055889 RepID=UPI0036560300
MTTLRDLLQLAADRGLSTRAMEKQVEDAARTTGEDMRLNRGTVSQILSGKYKSQPSDATIRAVAFLAGVPPRVAFEAAGLPAPQLAFRDELPDGVDQLSPKRRRVALDLLRALIEAEQLEHRVERLISDPRAFVPMFLEMANGIDDQLNPNIQEALAKRMAEDPALVRHLVLSGFVNLARDAGASDPKLRETIAEVLDSAGIVRFPAPEVAQNAQGADTPAWDSSRELAAFEPEDGDIDKDRDGGWDNIP